MQLERDTLLPGTLTQGTVRLTTDREIETTLQLPLYYSGLTDRASIREQGGKPTEYRLDREYRVEVPVKVGPLGIAWLEVE